MKEISNVPGVVTFVEEEGLAPKLTFPFDNYVLETFELVALTSGLVSETVFINLTVCGFEKLSIVNEQGIEAIMQPIDQI